ncbi:MAG TPA: cell division protein FtsZ [Chloroflexota bacterium]|nr:cell division protein FtsZ [Chloroflexota bacterium]
MQQAPQPHDVESFAEIKVIGAGGGGSNTIDRIVDARVQGIDLVVVNTDRQALLRSSAPTKLAIGDRLTKGLGAGGNPEIGERAAEENRDELIEQVRGADMVFITAGMGGGTGTGAAPVIAKYAQEVGALTIGVVTKPFRFEGVRKQRLADEGIARLSEHVDALIIVPNDRLITLADKRMSVQDAFALADDVLRQGIQGISDIITIPGLINVDFADVKAVMQKSGTALMAVGHGVGDTRALDAAKKAIESPLLDASISGARGVLLNVTGGSDLSLFEVTEAANLIHQEVDPEAQIIFGAVIDEHMQGAIKMTVIATGFSGQGRRSAASPTLPPTRPPLAPPTPEPPRPQPQPRRADESQIPAFLRRRNP